MTSALIYSFDSFLASLGIGILGRPESSRRKLILAFAAFDFIATLAGASLRSGLAQVHHLGGGWLPVLFAVALALAAGVVLAYSLKGQGALLLVPVLLSLDNFIAGLLGVSNQVPHTALIAGLASGLAAWAGFVAARNMSPLFSRRMAVVASASLLILAFVLAN
jgi:putative Mn2+ efflux pump MntP